MDPTFLLLILKALWVGVAVAAPVGPVGVYCVDQTLRQGLKCGLSAGLGAAVADMIWAGLATVLVGALLDESTVLEWKSEIFLSAVPVLIVLGLLVLKKAMQSEMRAEVAAASTMAINALGPRNSLSRAAGGAFLMTMSNPLTILGFAGWVTWLGFGAGGGIALTEGLIIVGGVFVGAMMWWCSIAGLLHNFRHHAIKFVPVLDYTCVVLTFGAMTYSAYEGWPAAVRISHKFVQVANAGVFAGG